MGASLHVLPHQSSSSGSSSRRLKPWMPPLFKLQVLLLAKMQWDVRHGPARASHPQDTAAWPAKPLARALRHMVSPCVAGDLLQQCAPGLVPHGYKTQTFVKQQGQVLNHGVAEQPYDVIGACDLSTYLVGVCHPMRACLQDGMPFEAIGEHFAVQPAADACVSAVICPLPLHVITLQCMWVGLAFHLAAACNTCATTMHGGLWA
jgi:hypothetical protein